MAVLRVDRSGAAAGVGRELAGETAVAVVHDGTTHAVMMATPADLEDFGIGFSRSEGVIAGLGDVAGIDVVAHDEGREVRLWLAPSAARLAVERRRRIVGPTGCGLCGLDSLAEAVRPAARVPEGLAVEPEAVFAAVRALGAAQAVGTRTRATHAAALGDASGAIGAVREDVGRHNALDKLIGHALRTGLQTGSAMVLITSRVSVEMVQKAAVLGAPVLVAVSAPTDLAVATAEAAGLTLCAVARDDAFEVFTRPDRIRTR